MDGMECNHPFFDNAGAYMNMIISQSDLDSFPKLCPLKKDSTTIKYETIPRPIK